jgi:hypothetical protein
MISDWLGIPAAFVAWGFALYVFLVAPRTRGARFLMAMLLVDGLAVITSYNNLWYLNPLLESAGLPPLPGGLHQASDWAVLAVYLPFLGMTLSSPWVRPLKHPTVSRMTLFGGLGIACLILFLPEDVRHMLNVPFYIVICIVLTWGFIAALHTWFTASSVAERERARAFTLAFGMRDVIWTITFAYFTAAFYGLIGHGMEELPHKYNTYPFLLPLSYALAVILYVPLVAYGVLRLQLFDIDLRVKRTLRRGTVAAAFVATFFVVSEFASNYLSSRFGTVLGILGTGALMFFLDPIQRAAERLSNAAMPNTVETPEYESFRKLQVYDAALRAALEDGHISPRQRRVLDSMLKSMGIDRNIAQRMEDDALTAVSGQHATVEAI